MYKIYNIDALICMQLITYKFMGKTHRTSWPFEKRPNPLPPFELSKSTASRAHTLTWMAKELIRCHVTVHVSEGNGEKEKESGARNGRRSAMNFFAIFSLSYFLEELTSAGSLSLSLGRQSIVARIVHFGIFFFSLLLFFLSLSPSLPHFLPRLHVSLSLATEISVARRDFFFSHLSLFRKLFHSFSLSSFSRSPLLPLSHILLPLSVSSWSFNFKGFMVLSIVDTNMEKVQDRWPNQEILTRNTYPRSQLDECCRET